MYKLSNSILIKSYKKAIELKLDGDFIQLFEKELIRRGINKTTQKVI